ncbi:MAG: helix-turn-helix transcriptional regulator, partial [Chloroflexia bacterium]|nr:helix-turn-helix transcriptional regulator [Chloroflexia bacterium]
MPANRIAELRCAAGYSKRRLMRRIGELSKGTITSPSYLANIECSRQTASPHFAEIAARALDC